MFRWLLFCTFHWKTVCLNILFKNQVAGHVTDTICCAGWKISKGDEFMLRIGGDKGDWKYLYLHSGFRQLQ